MYALKTFLIGIFIVLSFSGCEKKQISTELQEVHWDRDMCQRCKMVTSDRRNSVQVINPETGKSYMFDDIGCMFLWFVEDKIEWQDKAKVWINDVDTGKWIDAKEAYYSAGNITPMAYGFAAHAKKDNIIKKNKEVIMYDALPKLIIEMEEKNNNRRAY